MTTYPKDAWGIMSSELTDSRREKLEEVASQRTKALRLVLQDVHDPHNISACIRSAEAFGILDIDIVDPKFRPSTVSKGSARWLNIHKHEDVESCVKSLKEQGLLLAAAVPHPTATDLRDLPVEKGPIALIFGNESRGISPEWEKHIDLFFTIPMFGLVESLNISVSAAISMECLSDKLRKAKNKDYRISHSEQQELLAKWICQKTKAWELRYERLKERKNEPSRQG